MSINVTVRKRFHFRKIIAGEFDVDLRAWARDAKAFGSPILIEWGTEPNGIGLVGTGMERRRR